MTIVFQGQKHHTKNGSLFFCVSRSQENLTDSVLITQTERIQHFLLCCAGNQALWADTSSIHGQSSLKLVQCKLQLQMGNCCTSAGWTCCCPFVRSSRHYFCSSDSGTSHGDPRVCPSAPRLFLSIFNKMMPDFCMFFICFSTMNHCFNQ